jgi:N-acetylneuraminic acid mutarotase
MKKIVALALLCLLACAMHAQVNINAPWTWVNGEKHIPMRPVVGVKNSTAPSYNPGGRRDAVSWTDQNGIVWLFGGYGHGTNGEGFLNDLWKYNTITNQWTWVNGNDKVNVFGIYGSKGVPDNANNPGSRYGSCGWIDEAGNLYLFGGNGYNATARGMLNDLWKYNTTTNQWTWISGPGTVNATGVYGSQGVADVSNWPGARNGGTLWKGNDNKIWLFGGDGYAKTGIIGRLNDLWKYDPATTQWTWVSGLNGVNAASGVNGPGGRNTGNTAWKDNNGNLYLYGGATTSYSGYPVVNPPCGSGCDYFRVLSDFWRYNIATNTWTQLSTGGMTTHPDAGYHALAWNDNSGNLWLFGGFAAIRQSAQNSVAEAAHLNSLWKYNLLSGKWTRVKGDIYYTELYGNYGTMGVADTTNRRGGRASAITWVDATGKLGSFGGEFQEAAPLTLRNDIWVYDPLTNQYTWMKGDSASTVLPTYGTLGVADAHNKPGERRGAQTWSDKNGNLWLYGGNIKRTMDNPVEPCLNDFWKYNINSDQWTVVRNLGGISYGVKGVPSPSNKPNPKENAATWTDANNNLWIFGGLPGYGHQNDLWKYDIASDQWTWMSGDQLITTNFNQNAVYGTREVAASENKPGVRQGALSWTDNNNNLWLFGGSGTYNGYCINDLWKYNIASNQWAWMSGDNIRDKPGSYGIPGITAAGNKPGARNNGAAWKDDAGNLWLFGGNAGTSYFNDLWKYSIVLNQWTWILGDSTKNNSGVYGVPGVAGSGNKPGARYRPVSWTDDNGNFWLMGGWGYDGSGALGNLNDLWMYNLLTNQWTWVKGDVTINNNGLYGTKGIGSSLNKPGGRYGAAACRDEAGDVWIYGGFGMGETGQDRLSDLWKLSSGVSGSLVKVLEFKGHLVNNDGLLNWKTQNPGNVVAFEIERSTDRRNYIPVGTISANGATGIQQYDFTDPGITSLGVTVVYYRLKQTDVNGNVRYSNIVALTMDKSLLVLFYPNPVISSANITITIDNPVLLQARVINTAGALVKQYQWNLSAGSTSLSLDLDILASGVYYLDLSGEKISKRIPFMKQ